MKNIISRVKFFFVMLALWFLLNWSFDWTTLWFGLIISFFVSIFAFEVLHDDKGFRFKGIQFHRLIIYLIVLFFEIFKAAIMFSINLFKPQFVPRVFKMDLKGFDPVKVAIVANSITLTPGTISIDIVGHYIYVMVLADPATSQEDLEKPIRQTFERLLKEKTT